MLDTFWLHFLEKQKFQKIRKRFSIVPEILETVAQFIFIGLGG